MLKYSLTLAVISTVWTVNTISPAFAGIHNTIQLNSIPSVANSDPDN